MVMVLRPLWGPKEPHSRAFNRDALSGKKTTFHRSVDEKLSMVKNVRSLNGKRLLTSFEDANFLQEFNFIRGATGVQSLKEDQYLRSMVSKET